MKTQKKVFICIMLIIVLVLVFILSRHFVPSKDNVNVSYQPGSTYRFVCIYSGSSDYYKYSLKEGLDKAAEELNAWVKFYKFKSFEVDKHCEALDKAIAAKVDGIITNIPSNDAIRSYIEAAHDKNIPVITIESDLPDSRRISFIGTNSYAYGVEAGKLMSLATGAKSKTAVFRNIDSSRFNLKNQGFQNNIRNNPGMSCEFFLAEEPSIIGYTNTAQSIFVNSPQIDSFFCSDTESTLGVVRAMIEFNKTNSVVIGSGDSEEILKYIKNGIIYASLVEDPYLIGYLSIGSLLKWKKGESISECVNPDIIILSKENIDSVLSARKDKE